MPQLSCQDLCLGYEGKAVVSDLTFGVCVGDYLCIVGENGSGKSTLMKTILKLMAPISGQVLTGDGLAANEIGYLPQQTAVQKDFPASVREVVRAGCLNRRGMRPFYNKSEKRIADDNMKKLGIDSIAKRCYRELSGGQQQRALLARALCATRKILLLDEPAAGLDPKASAEMYDLIMALNSGGTTIIMISHDIAASVKYASHILHIGSQSALFFGTKADYLGSEIGRIYAGLGGEGI
ncbi:MAG: metal ABC transporter ATP-binding protein [Oscillospiraceae bacterium]|nr:metal ABC transporter ATP-binding protein [Oscillospiraceae bacterium]